MFKVVDVSSVSFPEFLGVKRNPPRKKEEMEDDYLAKYDFNSLFYDVFYGEGRLNFIGPPMRSLRGIVQLAEFYVNSRRIESSIFIDDRNKISRSYFDVECISEKYKFYGNEDDYLVINMGKLFSSVKIQNDFSKIFAEKKVLLTLSKNNNLEWIRDWAEFYVKNHGVESILFYDNGSDEYAPIDVLNQFTKVDGLVDAIVVPWNYKYGPTGKINDSNYCQYAMLEHARRRFLNQSEWVINADVDELMVVKNGTIDDALNESDKAGLLYSGRWISDYPKKDSVRHKNYYRYRSDEDKRIFPKWIVRPKLMPDKSLWYVHNIGEEFQEKVDNIYFGHFKAINNSWKEDRGERDHTKEYKIDNDILSAYKKIGWI